MGVSSALWLCSNLTMCGGHKEGNNSTCAANCTSYAQQSMQKWRLWFHQHGEVLPHAARCREPRCDVTGCRVTRRLYRHSLNCVDKIEGTCTVCRPLLIYCARHAVQCKTRLCSFPYCYNVKLIRQQGRPFFQRAQPKYG